MVEAKRNLGKQQLSEVGEALQMQKTKW